jgi:hypothetical protein
MNMPSTTIKPSKAYNARLVSGISVPNFFMFTMIPATTTSSPRLTPMSCVTLTRTVFTGFTSFCGPAVRCGEP